MSAACRLRRPLLLACAAVVAAVTCALPAAAEWHAIGPRGGGVSAFAVDPRAPDTVYAAVAFDGLWRTRDGGESWAPVGPRNRLVRFQTLLVHPQRSRSLVATTATGGFVRSNDHGRTWTPANRGLPRVAGVVRAGELAVAATAPRTLYLVAYHQVEGERPYRSDDGGDTWTLAAGELPRCGLDFHTPLAVHPTNSQSVLFGCDSGLFRSTDGGRRWRRAGALRGIAIQAIAWDPTVADRVYATVWRPGGGTMLYASTDGGRTWDPRAGYPHERYRALVADPHQSGTLYVGSESGNLFRSSDGEAPTPVGGGLPPPNRLAAIVALAADPRDNDRFWVATGYAGQAAPGLYRNDSPLEGWSPKAPPVRAAGVADFEPSRAEESVLLAAVQGARPLARSADGGQTWHAVSTPFEWVPVSDLEADPVTPAAFFAGTPRGVYRSIDGGLSWGRLGAIASVYDTASRLAVAAVEPRVLYAVFDNQLSISRDGGQTWALALAAQSNVADVAVAPSSPGVAYATIVQCVYGHCHSALARSVDGVTWTPAGILTAGAPILVDAADAGVVWAGARDAVLRVDALTVAATSLAIPGAGQVTALAQDADAPQRLLAGNATGEVWESRDAGASWERLAGKLDLPVQKLALDPFDAATVYAATPGGLYAARTD